MSFLEDLRFTEGERPTMAAFNERLETLNRLNGTLGDEFAWEKGTRVPYTVQLDLINNFNIKGGSAGNTETVLYSSAVQANENLTVNLVNPISATWSFETKDQASVLVGKYFKFQNMAEIYYGVGDFLAHGSNTNYYIGLDVKKVIAARRFSHTAYVNSPSSSAFPPKPSDGYTYRSMGRLGEKIRILKGSYLGTGTYGETNQTKLSVDGTILLLYLTRESVVNGYGNPITESGWMLIHPGIKTVTVGHFNSYGSGANTIILNDGIVSWYSSGTTPSAVAQFNVSGQRYYYTIVYGG